MQPDSRGQPGLIPGAAGFPAMNPAMQAFLGQQGQIQGMQGHAILAQRLAVLPQGGRGGMGAANQGYRAAASMGMMAKPPGRKGGASVKGRKSCNCKNSKCLKLYCECFASGRYCDNCNCLSCFNNKDNEAVRQSAVESILERNPNAFRPKIQTAEGDTHPQSIRNAPDGTVRHTKGCNCKKSSCLKKYCECFQGGIFCTEICKCVDCKNFDGSEARAQVISHHGDPFGMHSAAAVAAAQQQARQRPPRLQLQQQANLQTSLMQQQLAAGAQHAAGLQQLHALTGLGLSGHAGLQTSASLAAVPAAAALTPAGSTAAALPQLPVRPPISDAIHGLVKPELVEEITSLLLIVAKEEADKLAAKQQQQQEAAGLSSSTAVIKSEPMEGTAAGGGDMAAAADAALCNGLKRKRGSGDGAGEDGDGPAAAKRAHTGDISGVGGEGAMEEDGQQQQQYAQNGVGGAAGEGLGVVLYRAQEGVVLQEFNAILQRILAQAEKKTATDAEAAVAAAAAAAAAVAAVDGGAADAAAADQAAAAAAAAAAAVAMFDGLSEGSDPAQQQQHYLQQMVAEQYAQHEQQQEHDAQQQLQDAKSLGRPQLQQQQALAQQALLMQAAAANGNLALLQQASRGLYLQNAAQQQQLVPPMPLMQGGGMGVQGGGMGLRPNAGLQSMQMIQVVAQDGSVHQVPAQALMQLQLAAGGLQQQQLSAAAAAVQGSAGAAGGVSAALAAQQQQPVSLLSLLNGTGTTSGNSP